MIRRGLRLELVAAAGIALAVPAVAFAAQSVATQTTVSVETHDQAGRTQATAVVTVTGQDRQPVSGSVFLADDATPLAGGALNKQGQATLVVSLPAGQHSLAATYIGDATHASSASAAATVQALTVTTPDFQISINPATLTLGLGQSGNITTSITPENSSALTAPMFVTLSCSGMPDQSSCVFNPENIEIRPNATAAITSSLVLQTQQQNASLARPRNSRFALAILLPGAFCLGGLAWSFRRRPRLQRLSLLALVALVSTLGTTACNARYDYYNHGPPPNVPTPAGTYTINVTAQSSNGVTAITHTTTLAFTVQ
jgi:hypothetical protein